MVLVFRAIWMVIKIKKTILLLVLATIFLCSIAFAQIAIPDAEKGKTTCGDGIREGHEMCEPKGENLCPQAGKIIGIAMNCDPRDCSCVPKTYDCGDQIRESAEYCDPGEKETPEENDFCPKLGELFNEKFTCDSDTCLCKPEKAFARGGFAVCGDGNVTGSEECEKDADCRSNEQCTNCTCIITQRDISEIKEELKNETAAELPVVQKKEEKEEGFDYHDLVGVALPNELSKDFKEEEVNVHVMLDAKNGSVIGVVVSHGVIQEFVDNGVKSPSFDVYVKKSKAEEIANSENRTKALLKAIENKDIKYKPRGFFNRIIFWFKNLF